MIYHQIGERGNPTPKEQQGKKTKWIEQPVAATYFRDLQQQHI
jgi:hypothetical protein